MSAMGRKRTLHPNVLYGWKADISGAVRSCLYGFHGHPHRHRRLEYPEQRFTDIYFRRHRTGALLSGVFLCGDQQQLLPSAPGEHLAEVASSVPATFRFSVKVPKAITHEARLVGAEKQVQAFLGEAGLLREKLAVLLVQLPPSLELDVRAPLPSSGTFVLPRWPASQLNRVMQAGSALKETPCCARWAYVGLARIRRGFLRRRCR